jgi:hypothetical protein
MQQVIKTTIQSYVVLSLLFSAAAAMGQDRGNLAADREAVANGWRFDYVAARAEAVRTKRPMMIVFRCVP